MGFLPHDEGHVFKAKSEVSGIISLLRKRREATIEPLLEDAADVEWSGNVQSGSVTVNVDTDPSDVAAPQQVSELGPDRRAEGPSPEQHHQSPTRRRTEDGRIDSLGEDVRLRVERCEPPPLCVPGQPVCGPVRLLSTVRDDDELAIGSDERELAVAGVLKRCACQDLLAVQPKRARRVRDPGRHPDVQERRSPRLDLLHLPFLVGPSTPLRGSEKI